MVLSDQEIGKRIRTARKACHLTQNKFAAKIHVAQQTLSRYENGINAVPNDLLEHIAKELDEKIVGRDVDFPEKLGVIIETPIFIPYLSGYRNLKILSEYRHCISNQQLYEVLKMVGLQEVGKMPVRKYSLGMRQRLGIAQAIMEDPDVLVLDEPFNGLDRQGVLEMREILLGMCEKGKNIVIASHSEEDIGALCNNVLHMENGRLI